MINKALVLKALEQDCELRHRYVLGNKTCVLGCLALLAGVKPEYFDERTNGKNIHELPSVMEAIGAKFGLTAEQQHDLQELNDAFSEVDERREHILSLVHSYAIEDMEAPVA